MTSLFIKRCIKEFLHFLFRVFLFYIYKLQGRIIPSKRDSYSCKVSARAITPFPGFRLVVAKPTKEMDRSKDYHNIVQQRLDSGKSVKDFCADSGIRPSLYYYWRIKHQEQSEFKFHRSANRYDV